MESQSAIIAMLNMMERPAFCVRGGTIVAANPAALSRFIPVDSPVAPLLVTGQEEYTAFDGGWLCLTLCVSGTDYSASVRQVAGYHIFALEQEAVTPGLQALALASQELRIPLSDIISISEHLFSKMDGDSAARLNHGLHRLLRLIGNMSGAARFSGSTPNLVTQDVDALLREQFERAAALCEHKGIRVEYTGLPTPTYSLIDAEQLEHSVYEIISNSMKHTPEDGSIQAKLTRHEDTLRLTVQDTGSGLHSNPDINPYDRFLREPSVTDSERGIGLGMRIIHAFAAAHGGTVLLTSPEGCGLRLMLTLPIRLDNSALSSPMARICYSGERDSALIALSDSLPTELYSPHDN